MHPTTRDTHKSGLLFRVRDKWRPLSRQINVLRFALIFMDTLLSFASKFQETNILQCLFLHGIPGYFWLGITRCSTTGHTSSP